MFFLGLLSTPLPYLLLAAFYFFGFAMGMFNNSTGEEQIETAVSVTIPVEAKQETDSHAVYHYYTSSLIIHSQTNTITTEDSVSSFPPGAETVNYPLQNEKIKDFCFSGFRFSRPPPFNC